MSPTLSDLPVRKVTRALESVGFSYADQGQSRGVPEPRGTGDRHPFARRGEAWNAGGHPAPGGLDPCRVPETSRLSQQGTAPCSVRRRPRGRRTGGRDRDDSDGGPRDRGGRIRNTWCVQPSPPPRWQRPVCLSDAAIIENRLDRAHPVINQMVLRPGLPCANATRGNAGNTLLPGGRLSRGPDRGPASGARPALRGFRDPSAAISAGRTPRAFGRASRNA